MYENVVTMTGDKVDATALRHLIRAAVVLNLRGKSKSKPRRASSTRADYRRRIHLATMAATQYDERGRWRRLVWCDDGC